jgi:hypothetical protein
MYDEVLGMCFNKADAKLDNEIFFKYVAKTGKNICCICNKSIDSYDELSLEHVLPYEKELYSDNPKRGIELFVDKSNVKFAHKGICNRADSEVNSLGEDVIGVRREPNKDNFMASIFVNGKPYTVGRYKIMKQAQIAYDIAAYKTRKGKGLYNFTNLLEKYAKELQQYDNIDVLDFLSIRRGPIKDIVYKIYEDEVIGG